MTHSEAIGRYGQFGGQYVAETLMPALEELETAYADIEHDPDFKSELRSLLQDYVGRPTPLYYAKRLSEDTGLEVWLKREDLCHTGAHKINNTIAQVLLAKRMRKARVIAETGAGQHGVATATACALLDIPCEVYMGAQDVQRQAPNVLRMELLGAKVHAVHAGSRTLKDAMNEALRDWVSTVKNTYYCVGSTAGPHPYPKMVRDFQRIIGQEVRVQLQARGCELPDAIIACVGGGSNAMGIFHEFVDDADVILIGVEAAGEGLETGRHAAPLNKGTVGVLHGAKSYVLQNTDGQILEAHSISAGLDYPGVGPEHAYLKDIGRAHYVAVGDREALDAFGWIASREGILPALESSHAIAYVRRLSADFPKARRVVVNLSGRGDKDLATVQSYLAGL